MVRVYTCLNSLSFCLKIVDWTLYNLKVPTGVVRWELPFYEHKRRVVEKRDRDKVILIHLPRNHGRAKKEVMRLLVGIMLFCSEQNPGKNVLKNFSAYNTMSTEVHCIIGRIPSTEQIVQKREKGQEKSAGKISHLLYFL